MRFVCRSSSGKQDPFHAKLSEQQPSDFESLKLCPIPHPSRALQIFLRFRHPHKKQAKRRLGNPHFPPILMISFDDSHYCFPKNNKTCFDRSELSFLAWYKYKRLTKQSNPVHYPPHLVPVLFTDFLRKLIKTSFRTN